MSNDTDDELCNALHHLDQAKRLELAIVPRYPRPRARPDVLRHLAQARIHAELALRAAEAR